MSNNISSIHAKKIGQENLPSELADIPFNSLIPILVEALKQKTKTIGPIDVLRELELKNEFFGLSLVSQKELSQFQSLFFEILPPDFKSIQLSPIEPLGACTSITKLGQNERLTTIRKSEVVSDSTIFLAYHAASKRRLMMKSDNEKYGVVKMATFHRLLRLQKFDVSKKWYQHFEIVGMITAGRKKGRNSLRNDMLCSHIQIWIDLFEILNSNGYHFENISIAFSYIPLIEWIIGEYGVSRQEVTDNSLNGDYNYFDHNKVDLPKRIENVNQLQEYLSKRALTEKIYKTLVRFECEVMEPLRKKNPRVSFFYEIDRKSGLGYYNGICFHGFANNYNGECFDLIDGGASNWVSQILSDEREITVTSSFGVEMALTQFKKNQ